MLKSGIPKVSFTLALARARRRCQFLFTLAVYLVKFILRMMNQLFAISSNYLLSHFLGQFAILEEVLVVEEATMALDPIVYEIVNIEDQQLK